MRRSGLAKKVTWMQSQMRRCLRLLIPSGLDLKMT